MHQLRSSTDIVILLNHFQSSQSIHRQFRSGLPLSQLPWPFPRLLPLYSVTPRHLPIYPQTNRFVFWVVVKQCPGSDSLKLGPCAASDPSFSTSFVESYGHGRIRPSDCGRRCSYRCSATSHRKPCMFFCQKCCAKCLFVLPGTYGNKQVCPCYNNWKTKEGGPKCP